MTIETNKSEPETPEPTTGVDLEPTEEPGELKLKIFSSEPSIRRPKELIVEIIHSVQSGRELAWRMFVRNLRGLYRQTMLGLFWAFLPPLANTAIWVFLYTRTIVDFGDNLNVAYVAYVLAGMVLWQSFVEAINAPLKVVKSNSSMLSKLRFPRESVLMVGLYESIFNLVIRSAVLLPILAFFVVAPQLGMEFKAAYWSWATLFAPLGAVLLILLGMGIGMLILPLGMLYHDIGRALIVITPIWMILTQIVYPPPTDDWASSPINWLNPASPLLLATRDLLVLGQTEHLISCAVYAAIAVPLFVFGVIVFRISIPVLVERI